MADQIQEKPKDISLQPEDQPTLSSSIAHRRRALGGIKGKIIPIVFTALAARGYVDTFNDSANLIKENVNPPASTLVAPSEHSDGNISKEEIEQKYKIKLLTMKEAYQFLHFKYDDQDPKQVGQRPPVRWNYDQLELIDEELSYEPQSLIEQIGDNNLQIFLGEFGTNCPCGGISEGNSGVIGLTDDSVNPSQREWSFSALTHELTHRRDAATDQSIHSKIKDIFGVRLDYLKSHPDLVKPYPDADVVETILSLSDQYQSGMGDHKNFSEGVAELSQIYVKGYDHFMLALGPLIDGDQSSYKVRDQFESFDQSFPKTQALYELYKNDIFGGKEFDLGLIDKIKHGAKQLAKIYSEMEERKEKKEASVSPLFQSTQQAPTEQATPQPSLEPSPSPQTSDSNPINEIVNNVDPSVKKDLESLEKKYKITIISNTEKPLSKHYVERLKKVLSIFPEELFSSGESKLTILLFHYGTAIPNGNISSIDIESLNSIGFYIPNTTVLDAAAEINRDLIRFEEKKNYKLTDKVFEILGGEEFIKDPEKLYPKLKDLKNFHDESQQDLLNALDSWGDEVSLDLTISIFADFYLSGWDKFSQIGQVTDPNLSKEDLRNKNFDISKSKVGRLYEAFKKIYGVEYGPAIKGIPTVLPK